MSSILKAFHYFSTPFVNIVFLLGKSTVAFLTAQIYAFVKESVKDSIFAICMLT